MIASVLQFLGAKQQVNAAAVSASTVVRLSYLSALDNRLNNIQPARQLALAIQSSLTRVQKSKSVLVGQVAA